MTTEARRMQLGNQLDLVGWKTESARVQSLEMDTWSPCNVQL